MTKVMNKVIEEININKCNLIHRVKPEEVEDLLVGINQKVTNKEDEKEYIVFNIDMFDWQKELILLEEKVLNVLVERTIVEEDEFKKLDLKKYYVQINDEVLSNIVKNEILSKSKNSSRLEEAVFYLIRNYVTSKLLNTIVNGNYNTKDIVNDKELKQINKILDYFTKEEKNIVDYIEQSNLDFNLLDHNDFLTRIKTKLTNTNIHIILNFYNIEKIIHKELLKDISYLIESDIHTPITCNYISSSVVSIDSDRSNIQNISYEYLNKELIKAEIIKTENILLEDPNIDDEQKIIISNVLYSLAETYSTAYQSPIVYKSLENVDIETKLCIGDKYSKLIDKTIIDNYKRDIEVECGLEIASIKELIKNKERYSYPCDDLKDRLKKLKTINNQCLDNRTTLSDIKELNDIDLSNLSENQKLFVKNLNNKYKSMFNKE